MIALPFAVGCGFAGGGLREACPKEAIWQFSPFVFMDLPKHVWQMVRKLEPNWQIILLLAPVALELLRRTLGVRFGEDRLFFLNSPSPWMMTVVVLATVLGVATPIKIWNSARIEHRLQEQEKLLLAAQDRGAQESDQPALPVQHADLDLVADPLAARHGAHAHHQALGPAASAAAEPPALRHAARGAGVDRRVSRHRGDSLRAEAARPEGHRPDTLGILVPSMILQPLVENSIKHGLSRKVGPGSITIRSHASTGRAVIEVEDDGMGFMLDRLGRADVERDRTGERPRTPAGDLRRRVPADADSEPGKGTMRASRSPS